MTKALKSYSQLSPERKLDNPLEKAMLLSYKGQLHELEVETRSMKCKSRKRKYKYIRMVRELLEEIF